VPERRFRRKRGVAYLGQCLRALSEAEFWAWPYVPRVWFPARGRVCARARVYIRGSHPVLGGKVNITGPTLPAEGPNHQGAPFGLSIVNPVIVGPFDLGTVPVCVGASKSTRIPRARP
jgi:hypothetical protein